MSIHTCVYAQTHIKSIQLPAKTDDLLDIPHDCEGTKSELEFATSLGEGPMPFITSQRAAFSIIAVF